MVWTANGGRGEVISGVRNGLVRVLSIPFTLPPGGPSAKNTNYQLPSTNYQLEGGLRMWFATEMFRRKPSVPANGGENARTGVWGEEVAARFLRNHGWEVIGRRVRPCRRDRRCEIDVIVRSGDGATVAFVEVKTVSVVGRRQAQEERAASRVRQLAYAGEVARELPIRCHTGLWAANRAHAAGDRPLRERAALSAQMALLVGGHSRHDPSRQYEKMRCGLVGDLIE